MLHIVLYEPEIPPNTGNVIRLAANTGARLHLVEPLGFSLDTAQLRRAGLDYHDLATLTVHGTLDACLEAIPDARLFALSTHGTVRYDAPAFRAGDVFLFGPESRGLPGQVREDPRIHTVLRLPMRPGARSLNLSNAVAVVVFEALRQLDFQGPDGTLT